MRAMKEVLLTMRSDTPFIVTQLHAIHIMKKQGSGATKGIYVHIYTIIELNTYMQQTVRVLDLLRSTAISRVVCSCSVYAIYMLLCSNTDNN